MERRLLRRDSASSVALLSEQSVVAKAYESQPTRPSSMLARRSVAKQLAGSVHGTLPQAQLSIGSGAAEYGITTRDIVAAQGVVAW